MSKGPIDDVHCKELNACEERVLDNLREKNFLFATAVLHDDDYQ